MSPSPLARMGWTECWSAADREACRAEHAICFNAHKLRHFGTVEIPISRIPGMLDSLNALLELGYSFTDVGVMFGVSRQRVAQWRDKYHLGGTDGRGPGYRTWDDARNRFVAISRREVLAQARTLLESRREREARERRETERGRHVEALRRLARTLGRSPTLSEVADDLGYAGIAQGAARYWRGVNGARTHAEMTAEMYRAAGLRKYKPGGRSTNPPAPLTPQEASRGHA